MSPKLHNKLETELILEYPRSKPGQITNFNIFGLWQDTQFCLWSTVWNNRAPLLSRDNPCLHLFPTVIINSTLFHSQKCPSLDKNVYGHPASMPLAIAKHIYTILQA